MIDKVIKMAEKAGYDIWATGGGCEAIAKRPRSQEVGDDEASLDVMITVEGGTSINGDPLERCWEAGASYMSPQGGEDLETREGLTLAEALSYGDELVARADELWKKAFGEDGPQARTRRP